MPIRLAVTGAVTGFFSGFAFYWFSTIDYAWWALWVGAILGVVVGMYPTHYKHKFIRFVVIPIWVTGTFGLVALYVQMFLEREIEWLGPLSLVIGILSSVATLYLDKGDEWRKEKREKLS